MFVYPATLKSNAYAGGGNQSRLHTRLPRTRLYHYHGSVCQSKREDETESLVQTKPWNSTGRQDLLAKQQGTAVLLEELADETLKHYVKFARIYTKLMC